MYVCVCVCVDVVILLNLSASFETLHKTSEAPE